MTLRTYILTICGGIIAVVVGFIYLQSNVVLGQRFRELESVHIKSVKEFSGTILKAKIYLLSTFRSDMNKGNELSTLLLLSGNPNSRAKLKKELDRIQSVTGCDVVDLIDFSTGRSLRADQDYLSKKEMSQVASGNAFVRLSQVREKPVLLSYSPLRLYRDVTGVVVIGFFLNDTIAADISEATRAKVRFLAPSESSAMQAISLDLDDASKAGEPFRVVVESNFVEQVKEQTAFNIILAGFISILSVIALIYIFLNAGFIRNFQEVLFLMNDVSEGLSNGIVRATSAKKYPIKEVTNLSETFANVSESLQEFKNRVEEKSRTEAIGEMTAQVAHDLKGPVAALEAALDIDKAAYHSATKKEAIRGLLLRIRNIASDVNKKARAKGSDRDSASLPSTGGASLCNLSELVDSIVAEKSFQYKEREKLSLLIDPLRDQRSPFAEVDATEFQRVLSNLVDNAVQAISDRGTVTVKLFGENNNICIEIIDNGSGIPRTNLERLCERGFSAGKRNGSGLGLWHAKKTVELWEGSLAIHSQEGIGTRVTLKFQRAQAPAWFLPHLKIKERAQIVILDDDPQIHEMWKERLQTLNKNIEVIHFQKAEELVIWQMKKQRGHHASLYFCDYELEGEPWNGLQVIEELGISEVAILVTGHYHNVTVRAECERLGVKILSKTAAPSVSILLDKGKKKSQRVG